MYMKLMAYISYYVQYRIKLFKMHKKQLTRLYIVLYNKSMRYLLFWVTFTSFFIFGCLPQKNKILTDEQTFDSVLITRSVVYNIGGQTFEYKNDLSIMEIYNVLKNNILNFSVELFYLPENPPLQKDGKIYVINRQMITLDSEKYRISVIQYSIDSDETNGIIYISYVLLKGDNVNELIEPMENIKQCFISYFSDNLDINNIYEELIPLPKQH